MKEKTIRAIQSLRFPFVVLIAMWAIHLVKVITGIPFVRLGILPRHIEGLKGILTAPLIHGDWAHLISNTVPFAVLSAIIFLFYRRVAVRSFLLIYLFTGAGVWLFARNYSSVGDPIWHIGASGVVYGLLSFVFWNGVFRRSFKAIALALIILVMYSGYFLGIVPNQPGISWESHLYGALVGIAVSYLFKDSIEQDEEPEPVYVDEPYDERYLLPRDTFEKTLAERQREREMWRSDHTGTL